jgi:hypothetical protein
MENVIEFKRERERRVFLIFLPIITKEKKNRIDKRK